MWLCACVARESLREEGDCHDPNPVCFTSFSSHSDCLFPPSTSLPATSSNWASQWPEVPFAFAGSWLCTHFLPSLHFFFPIYDRIRKCLKPWIICLQNKPELMILPLPQHIPLQQPPLADSAPGLHQTWPLSLQLSSPLSWLSNVKGGASDTQNLRVYIMKSSVCYKPIWNPSFDMMDYIYNPFDTYICIYIY